MSLSKVKVAGASSGVESINAFKLYVGIDFGTYGTGLAYVFAGSSDVIIHNQWMVTKTKYPPSIKPQTTLLIDPQNECMAYGREAVEIYLMLNPVIQDTWMLFEYFKMALFQRNIKTENKNDDEQLNDESKMNNHNSNNLSDAKCPISMELQATNGKYFPTSNVFMHAFNKIKKEIQRGVKQRFKLKHIQDHEIQYILTVPAIWDETAKHYMNEWAIEAGLVDGSIANQLRIVYEPDCASLSIQHKMQEMMETNNNNTTLAKGDKYILVDAGGGTCDIACHQILGDLTNYEYGVKEVLHPSGGAWGSIFIDKEFKKILNSIFSKLWMDEFHSKFSQADFHIMENFRIAKEKFNNDDEKEKFHNLRLPFLFVQFIEEKLEADGKYSEIDEIVDNCILLDTKGLAVIEEEYLALNKIVWKSMFDVVLGPIINHCHELLSDSLMVECKHLCLVGGLSCNSYFAERMKVEFGEESKYKLNIIQPERPMLSVVEGAALMGISRNYIRARVLSKTYGYSVSICESECIKLGISELHIAENLFFSELVKVNCVRKCFAVIARKGEAIITNQVINDSCYRNSLSYSTGYMPILCSDKIEPLVESDGQQLAAFVIEFDESNHELKVITEFHFHDTMMRVFAYSANNIQNKKEVILKYEFR